MSWETSVPALSSTSGRPRMTLPTIGSRLPVRKVSTVSRSCISGRLMSWPSERFPSTFFAAAFIAFSEPSKVSAASSAVVPVTPISSCMTWIASMILSKLTLLTVSAVTVMVSPSTPESLISRAISACVPP